MKITIVHPAIGKIPGKKYLRAWQMEPLPVAQLCALMPDDVEVSFFDDRMEAINYDHPADLMIISVETYTAKRAYQIASEFRQRNIPVIMGGFHTTLYTDEVLEYADAVVTGEVENIWHEVLDDFKNSELKKLYKGTSCTFENDVLPDRTLFENKNYVNISLLEAGRGCKFSCEFCSIHNFFKGKHHYRDIENIIHEIKQLKRKTKLHFFVDDNIVANQQQSVKLFKALKPLKIKWVGQADITIAQNPELLKTMVDSGCQGVLIGFESMNMNNLKNMKKNLLPSVEAIEDSIKQIHKAGLRIYATFLFGYENDTYDDFDDVLKFCIRNKFFMVGFNNLTPFPGTKLYERLQDEGRLLYDKWWLSDEYFYGQIPFNSKVDNKVIEQECRRIRRKFYGLPSILYRLTNRANINSFVMTFFYLSINLLMRNDTTQRKRFPLGDLGFTKQLQKAKI